MSVHYKTIRIWFSSIQHRKYLKMYQNCGYRIHLFTYQLRFSSDTDSKVLHLIYPKQIYIFAIFKTDNAGNTYSIIKCSTKNSLTLILTFFCQLPRCQVSPVQHPKWKMWGLNRSNFADFLIKHNKIIIIHSFHHYFSLFKSGYTFLPLKNWKKKSEQEVCAYVVIYTILYFNLLNSSLCKAHPFKMPLYSMECNQRRPVQGATVVLHQYNNTAIHKLGHRCGLLKHNNHTVSMQLSSLPDYSNRYNVYPKGKLEFLLFKFI